MKIDVLYEDNHCLVVNKPAGVLSQAAAAGDPCLVSWAGDYLKARYHKPGRVYIGLVHRLDRPTSGAIVLARTSKAASRLSGQFRSGRVDKMYWAIVEGRPELPEGHWDDILQKHRRLNRVRLVADPGSYGRVCQVNYRVVKSGGGFCKLELHPASGRSHQLRVQLAGRGLPILGDRKYGAKQLLMAEDGNRRIALHARKLRFEHPTREELISIVAPVPGDWPESVPGWWKRARRAGGPSGR
jgi:23S rRNA pseudouridine1911/1915/1917 synthase